MGGGTWGSPEGAGSSEGTKEKAEKGAAGVGWRGGGPRGRGKGRDKGRGKGRDKGRSKGRGGRVLDAGRGVSGPGAGSERGGALHSEVLPWSSAELFGGRSCQPW